MKRNMNTRNDSRLVEPAGEAEARRDALIRAFHERAMILLDREDTETARQEIADLLQELSMRPNILPSVELERLHDAGTTATILHEGPDGRGALMLLRLPSELATPIHNHHSWGVACVVEGINRYWRWERLDDLQGPDRAKVRLVEVFEHGPGDYAMWGDPPQDLHAQQGVDEPAYEFVFFGRNPNLQPRSYFDPETGIVTHAAATDSMTANANVKVGDSLA